MPQVRGPSTRARRVRVVSVSRTDGVAHQQAESDAEMVPPTRGCPAPGVIVIDPRPLLRVGLARVASAALRCPVLAGEDPRHVQEELATLAVPGSPRALLLSLLPRQSPAAALARARVLGLPVILALECEDADQVREALGTDAEGHLLLELADVESVRETITTVVAGRFAVPLELEACRLPRGDHLPSQRCLQVVRALAAGLHDDAIAQSLGISVSAVRKHLCLAQVRLHAQTRPQLIARAARLGLL